MINFNSLFNQFKSQTSALGDLLSQPNTPMSRILDEESFQNDYISGSPKITQFMTYQKFSELVEFVTVVGPANDKKRSYKFKYFQIIQILSCNNGLATEFFLPERPLTVDQKIVEEVQVEVEIQVQQVPEVNEDQDSQLLKLESVENKQQSLESKSQQQNQAEDEVVSSPIKQQLPITSSKKFKKVIQKQVKTVQKILKKQVQPLINLLISYFDGEVNYTLAGYVSKILTTFFNKKPVQVDLYSIQFLKYILQDNITEKLLNHAESRSVGELIIKILVSETTVSLPERREFYKSLLKRVSIPGQIFVLSNLSAYICEIIQKVTANLKGPNKIVDFNQTFFSLDVITQIINNVISSQENVSIYNAPILFCYLTNVPFVLPQQQNIIDDFKQLLEMFIDSSIQKLQISSDRPKLGTGRVKIIEILRYILKENILSSKDIVAVKVNFFPTLFELVKKYDMNNMLHNQIMKIIQTALTDEENSPLNDAILRDKILLNFISQQISEDQKIKTGTSVYKSRKGYIAHIINLCVKLRELSEKNSKIRLLTASKQFIDLYDNFVVKQIFNSKKALAGYFVKKNIKYGVMFQREDIIASYAAFLQNCPNPIFEAEAEHVNIEHPDLIEELQKQLQQNKTIQLIEQIAVAQAAAANQIDSNQNPQIPQAITPNNLFTVHMEYNVDDLLAEL